MPVHEIRHPLIRHKLGIMRRADLSTKSFRELSQEVGALLTYEASKDLPLAPATVEGWCGSVEVEKIAGKKVTVVPILRAGIGMLDGVLSLIPGAKVSVSAWPATRKRWRRIPTWSAWSANWTSAWR